MAKVLHLASANNGGQSFSFNVTNYFPALTMGFVNLSSESDAQSVYRTAGVASDLQVLISANTIATSASSFSSRKNGSAGNLTVSIGAGATGYFTDSAHADNIAAGDAYNFVLTTPNTSGALTLNHFAWWVDTATATLRTGVRDYGINTNGYIVLVGNAPPTASEAAAQSQMVGAGTMQKMAVRMRSNAHTTSMTGVSRINGSNGTLTLTVGSGATGLFEDTTHSDSYALGDLVCWNWDNGGGTGAALAYGPAVELVSASVLWVSSNRGNKSIAAGATAYMQPIGGYFFDTTESRNQYKMAYGGQLSLLTVYVGSNGVSASTTVRTRINTANGAQSVSIGAGATGQFQDGSNTENVAVDDLVDIQVVAGAGGTTIVPQTTGLKFLISSSFQAAWARGANVVLQPGMIR